LGKKGQQASLFIDTYQNTVSILKKISISIKTLDHKIVKNMNNTKNLTSKEAIDKLKSLVNDINICLFCTNLKTDIGATARPMSAVKVCDQGNI